MFSRARPTADVAEDWTDQAWENPLSPSADARTTTLDGRVGLWWDETEVGLFGDGGFDRRRGATFAAQARAFGTLENYWLASRPAADMTASRMAVRYGYKAPTIHTAELAALIASLRWRRPGCWNLFFGDRSALFSAMERAASRSPGARNKLACAPFECRLRRVLAELSDAWEGTPHIPAWRLNQVAYPGEWNVQRPSAPESAQRQWLSQLAYAKEGMVGVDVKSHQEGPPCPYPTIVAGNEAQDKACDEARSLPRPPDVHLPTGGLFAFAILDGRMVTEPIVAAVRKVLRDQADVAWRRWEVQGKLAGLGGLVYTAVLDMRVYAQCTVATRWMPLLLQRDPTR